MPRVTKPLLHPNRFEKMSVSHAIRLYSNEVVRGLYLYNQKVERRFGTTTPTKCQEDEGPTQCYDIPLQQGGL
ncbi:hypothetical protein HPB47_017262 [Ixodes persulcatus]|uniref:Uncharacterized protein n=1 Tax=Ixodes persulcatus TaxID=34615 RepID=A0AC60QR91_IXOPE|nr:hypothetical protein HPB47_017262 [Ixodes persulcatus]